ncbi:MAG: relaxase MobL [Erysipelotrichaceae bacterium]
MAPDVLTRFHYLEHGKPAPAEFKYKGVINTESVVGYKNYGARKKSRDLSDEAKDINKADWNFYDYTNKRVGATKTFSSIGWIDNKAKNDYLKKQIAESFNKDGNLLWIPVISLRDYMTSTEMKLYTEEDYAAIINKVLPKFFKSAGFDNDNMLWWMDHHVNTDNPHVHLNFMERNQTKFNGKLPMKEINKLKADFWKEVFSAKRYLEATGKTVEEGFKLKDIFKAETFNSFKENFKTISDKELINDLKKLYSSLPENGRLQYNASHMIPYRSDIDLIVDKMLRMPEVKDMYNEFLKSLNEFDRVKSESLNTEYKSITKTEDNKLRVMMGNEILKNYKEVKTSFYDQHEKDIAMVDNIPINNKVIMIAASIILSRNDKEIVIKLPGHWGECIKLDTNKLFYTTQKGSLKFAMLEEDFECEIYNHEGKALGKYFKYDNISDYFIDGIKVLNECISSDIELETKRQLWIENKKHWIENGYEYNRDNSYKQNVKNMQRASFAWMNKIENEVNQGRSEFYFGKEFN